MVEGRRTGSNRFGPFSAVRPYSEDGCELSVKEKKNTGVPGIGGGKAPPAKNRDLGGSGPQPKPKKIEYVSKHSKKNT